MEVSSLREGGLIHTHTLPLPPPPPLSSLARIHASSFASQFTKYLFMCHVCQMRRTWDQAGFLAQIHVRSCPQICTDLFLNPVRFVALFAEIPHTVDIVSLGSFLSANQTPSRPRSLTATVSVIPRIFHCFMKLRLSRKYRLLPHRSRFVRSFNSAMDRPKSALTSS